MLNLPNIVMPGEPLIQKALSRINSSVPGFFGKVKEIRIAPGMGGYAYVTNKPEDSGIIFIDFNRIKTELGGVMSGHSPEEIEEAVIKALYSTVGHEEGHIKDEMKGGELPAENRAREIEKMVDQKYQKAASLYSACNIFMKLAEDEDEGIVEENVEKGNITGDRPNDPLYDRVIDKILSPGAMPTGEDVDVSNPWFDKIMTWLVSF